jgi:predicted Zn-dependent protease
MKCIGRFLTLHGRVLYYTLSLCISLGIAILLFANKISFFPALFLVCIIPPVLYFVINMRWYKYWMPFMSALEVGCDPYPLLEETEYMISKAKKGLPYFQITINYSIALMATGQYEKALSVLQGLDFTKIPKLSHHNMFVYYNNLCAACAANKQWEQHAIYQSKAEASYACIKKQAFKKKFSDSMLLHQISQYIQEKKYDEAEEALSSFIAKRGRESIMMAMTLTEIHIGRGETEQAKEQLQFIIENGNKLYAVTEARQILETL